MTLENSKKDKKTVILLFILLFIVIILPTLGWQTISKAVGDCILLLTCMVMKISWVSAVAHFSILYIFLEKKVPGVFVRYQDEHQPGKTKTWYWEVGTQYLFHGHRNWQKIGLHLDQYEEVCIFPIFFIIFWWMFVLILLCYSSGSISLNNIQIL